MTQARTPSPPRIGLRLGLFALICFAALALTQWLTATRIASAEAQLMTEQLQVVLAETVYDNQPHTDTLQVTDPLLGSSEPQTVWRARLADRGVAVVLSATAAQGYNGPIELIVGVDRDGRVLGVSVLSHSETPGLGDAIERFRSDWIDGFDTRSLQSPPQERWRVRRDGGDFDQFTGATITPRAIVHAVRDALIFYQQQQDALFTRQTSNGKPDA